MRSKLITESEQKMLAFSECLKETGAYKSQSGEYLIVIHPNPHPVYFGMYSEGAVFSHVDGSGNKNKEYERIGDIELIVKIMENK